MKTVRLEAIAKEITVEGIQKAKPGSKMVDLPRITEGMHAKPLPRTPGLHTLEPEQLLNILIEPITINGRVEGYQRVRAPVDARRVANYLRDGGILPVVELAIDGKGSIYCPDGQARLLGAVIARVPLDAVVRQFNIGERSQLFSSQRHARRISPDLLTLTDDGPFERYIQEAVSGGAANPWSGFVSTSNKAKTRISPYAMYQLLIRYVANRDGTAARATKIAERWDRGLADDLFPLIRCFGTKDTNPAAFASVRLQGIGSAAMWVFRRNPRGTPGDQERWIAHMSKFPFGDYPACRSQRDWTDTLIAYWNKGLGGSRRLKRGDWT